jgi:hypothetical protein
MTSQRPVVGTKTSTHGNLMFCGSMFDFWRIPPSQCPTRWPLAVVSTGSQESRSIEGSQRNWESLLVETEALGINSNRSREAKESGNYRIEIPGCYEDSQIPLYAALALRLSVDVALDPQNQHPQIRDTYTQSGFTWQLLHIVSRFPEGAPDRLSILIFRLTYNSRVSTEKFRTHFPIWKRFRMTDVPRRISSPSIKPLQPYHSRAFHLSQMPEIPFPHPGAIVHQTPLAIIIWPIVI